MHFETFLINYKYYTNIAIFEPKFFCTKNFLKFKKKKKDIQCAKGSCKRLY